MKRLMIFGDSILKGVTYSGQKYQLCQGHDFSFLHDNGVEVENYSRMGATINTGLAVLKKKLAPCDENTTVLLSFGGNDCDYDWTQISENPDAEYEPRTPQPLFVESFRDAIRTIQNSGATVAVTSLLPIDAERYMQQITKGKNYNNILHWLGDVEHLYRWQEYYSSLACYLAWAFGCSLIDLRSEFLRSTNFCSLLSDDGIHPTQAGHDLIHKSVASALAWA